MILVEPQGGLANRLRVLASFTRISDYNLKVYWIKNNDLGACFDELFKPIENIKFYNELPFKSKLIKNTYQENFFKKKIVSFTNSILGIDFCINDELVKKNRNSNQFHYQMDLLNNRNIFYRGCEEIFDTKSQDFIHFIPVTEIQNIIDEQSLKFSKNIVGFHIRRTDHEIAIKKSPTILFYKKANEIIESGFQIFLSTDDQNLEKEMISKYGDSHIKTSQKSNFNRNKLDGVKEAVVDLFLLSKTVEIYGSYWSSFGTVASKIGQIKHSYLMD